MAQTGSGYWGPLALGMILSAGCADSEEQDTVENDPGGETALSLSDAGHPDSGGDDGSQPTNVEGATTSTQCFSPLQNTDQAYDDEAIGCVCSEDDLDQCVRGTALICDDGRWIAVIDGPCLPRSVWSCEEDLSGEVLWDTGDGSLLKKGCPESRPQLGIVGEGDQWGICCAVEAG